MKWINTGNICTTTLQALPELAAGFEALYRALWIQQRIPPATLQLRHLRLVQLHRYAVEDEASAAS